MLSLRLVIFLQSFFSKGFGHIDGIYDVKVGDGAPRVQQLKKKQTKKQLTKMS